MRNAALPVLLVVLGGCAGPRLVGPPAFTRTDLPAPVVRRVPAADTLAPAVAAQRAAEQVATPIPPRLPRVAGLRVMAPDVAPSSEPACET